MTTTTESARGESFADQVSRLRQMVVDNGETWDLSENDEAAIAAVLASHDALLAALKGLMADIDSGLLVRDISRDMESGWSMRMLEFVQRLHAAQAAIQKAEGR